MNRSRKAKSCSVAVVVSLMVFAIWTIARKTQADGARASSSTTGAARAQNGEGAHSFRTMPTIESLGNLPLAFEKNVGQADSSIKFIAQSGRSTVALNSQSISIHARKSFVVRFVGADRHNSPRGLDELPGERNYLLGNDQTKWRTQVP